MSKWKKVWKEAEAPVVEAGEEHRHGHRVEAGEEAVKVLLQQLPAQQPQRHHPASEPQQLEQPPESKQEKLFVKFLRLQSRHFWGWKEKKLRDVILIKHKFH
jgi:hypothetical protein